MTMGRLQLQRLAQLFYPEQSINALQYFYEDLGDSAGDNMVLLMRLKWEPDWYSDTWLAINQGPILVMIGYRTGLIWDLFIVAQRFNH